MTVPDNVYINAKGCFLLSYQAWLDDNKRQGRIAVNKAISLAKQRGYKQSHELRAVIERKPIQQDDVIRVVDELFSYIGDTEFMRDCMGLQLREAPHG